MAENTKIEWAKHTFNPWVGCTKVGPGCDHCYAEAMNIRFKGGNWGTGAPRRRTSLANWRKPVKWNKQAEAKGERYRVFCASLADVFDNEVDPFWRKDLMDLIVNTPHLDWLLLTKRIGNVEAMVQFCGLEKLPDNVWLGATIVNQEEADRDIPKLLSIPASVRFLSMEPLLGEVNITWYLERRYSYHQLELGHPTIPSIDWVIVGGESGNDARPMEEAWALSLRDQCSQAGVPFLFKQWGEYAPNWTKDCQGNRIPGFMWMDRMGKKIAGRVLDGKIYSEYPFIIRGKG